MNEYKCPFPYSSTVTGTICHIRKTLSMYACTVTVLCRLTIFSVYITYVLLYMKKTQIDFTIMTTVYAAGAFEGNFTT